MQMLYHSDSFAVVLFDVAEATTASTSTATLPGAGLGAALDADAHSHSHSPDANPAKLTHGGYEIVDKFARKEIFLQGAMAESFKVGVEALIQTRPSEEEIDDYIERFASLMQQPVILH